MKRREFMILLSGTASWPLTARAQPLPKLPTIGVLGPTNAAVAVQWTAALVQRLRELGWIEGRTVAIEYRWAQGRAERAAEISEEFVRLKVDVIVTSGTTNVMAARQVTSATPIVFAAAADPIGNGLVASLARPGGNATGLSNQSRDLQIKARAIGVHAGRKNPRDFQCCQFSDRPRHFYPRFTHNHKVDFGKRQWMTLHGKARYYCLFINYCGR